MARSAWRCSAVAPAPPSATCVDTAHGTPRWWAKRAMTACSEAWSSGNALIATTAGIATVVLHGTASDAEFATLAEAISGQLTELENEDA